MTYEILEVIIVVSVLGGIILDKKYRESYVMIFQLVLCLKLIITTAIERWI